VRENVRPPSRKERARSPQVGHQRLPRIAVAHPVAGIPVGIDVVLPRPHGDTRQRRVRRQLRVDVADMIHESRNGIQQLLIRVALTRMRIAMPVETPSLARTETWEVPAVLFYAAAVKVIVPWSPSPGDSISAVTPAGRRGVVRVTERLVPAGRVTGTSTEAGAPPDRPPAWPRRALHRWATAQEAETRSLRHHRQC
jgi:hypothetical protein